MFKQLLALFIVIGVCAAWQSPYSQPTCLPAYSVNNFNFTLIKIGNTSVNCESNNFFFAENGEYYTSASTAGRIYIFDAQNISIETNGATFNWYTHAPSDSKNHTMYITAGADCRLSNLTAEVSLTTSTYCNITYNSSSLGYRYSCDGSGALLTGADSRVNMLAPGANCVIHYPIYNDTVSKILGNQTNQNASNTSIPQIYSSLCSIAGDSSILYSDIRNSNATIINSKAVCQNTSPYYRTLLVYGTNTVVPKITYFPQNGVYLNEAFPYFYDPSSLLSFMRNNTVAYVMDSYNVWYTVPAIEVLDTSVVYTVSIFLSSTTSTGSTSTIAPLIATSLSCNQINDIYNITSNYSVAVAHLVYYRNSTTINSTSSTSPYFNFAINTTKYPIINYSVNGNPTCAKSNQSKIFGIANLGTINMGGAAFIPQIIFVASAAIGLFNPFAMLFAAVFNDLFDVITLGQMIIIIIVSILTSVVMAAYDRLSVKSLVLNIFICGGLLSQFYLVTGLDFSGIMIPINALQNFSLTSFSLESFAIGTFIFMVSLFGILLTLPLTLMNALTTNICLYASALCLGGLLSSIGNLIALGVYYTFGLMAYQIIRNTFISP